MNLLVILASVLCSSLAHVSLKIGAGQAALAGQGWRLLWQAAFNPWVMLGMALHVVALVVWVYALSRVPLNFAYPFIALGFVLVALISYWFLDEPLNAARLVGMGLIVAGVMFVARS